MAYINPYIKVNAGGIPRLEAIALDVNGQDVTYRFRPHRFLNYPYAGLLIFKLPANSTTTLTGNVYFNSGEPGTTYNQSQVYDYKGEAVVANKAALVTGGVFIGWYSDGKLLILAHI